MNQLVRLKKVNRLRYLREILAGNRKKHDAQKPPKDPGEMILQEMVQGILIKF